MDFIEGLVAALGDEEAKAIREQRRYEIAKELMAAHIGKIGTQWSIEEHASHSILCADALLAELEKKP